LTHEYVIALGGAVVGTGAAAGPATGPAATAIAWAADRVLAVGPDDLVRMISRGDSTLLDVRGCAVTAAPRDVLDAERLLRNAVATGRAFDASGLLSEAGLLDSPTAPEPGSPADLAFWSADPEAMAPGAAASLRIVAVVRAGAFTEGDEHCGPFPRIG
jgi:hypothetical protein